MATIFVKVNKFGSEWQKSVTKSGMRVCQQVAVFKGEIEISGNTEQEILDKYYKLNSRSHAFSYHEFCDPTWLVKYKTWLNSEDYKKRAMSLYYGHGFVD
jgi:hypothetical protein